MKMKEILTNEGYTSLTAAERREILKREQVAELTGWRAYPDTCKAILSHINDDMWSKYSVRQLAEIALCCHKAYQKAKELA